MEGSFRRAVIRWSAGIAISTPTIAILQGAILLYDYRLNHGDDTSPEMPCRGVVGGNGVKEASTKDKLSILSDAPLSSFQESPLRLLVIGDSLAAGVGLGKLSTPVLPASIAQTLSTSLNGRVVSWTCVGSPGSSASQILQEIHHLESMQPLVIQRFVDWQEEAREKAKESVAVTKRKAEAWLKQEKEPTAESPTSIKVISWLKRWLSRIGRESRGLNSGSSAGRGEVKYRKKSSNRKQLARKPTIDPSIETEKYDIAVVLTGLNDLKDSYLPFMMSKKHLEMLREARKENEEYGGDGTLKEGLIRIVDALGVRMKGRRPRDQLSTWNDNYEVDHTEAARCRNLRQVSKPITAGPLVVLPALPVSPIAISQIAPLCWFLVPLFRAMDRNKEVIAQMYPDLVLFIESPTLQSLVHTEDGESCHNTKDDGGCRLEPVDEANCDCRFAELFLCKQLSCWLADAEDGIYTLEADDVLQSHNFEQRQYPGASLLSADGIHPNDAGYNAWGRYIGRSVVDKWSQSHIAHLPCQVETKLLVG